MNKRYILATKNREARETYFAIQLLFLVFFLYFCI